MQFYALDNAMRPLYNTKVIRASTTLQAVWLLLCLGCSDLPLRGYSIINNKVAQINLPQSQHNYPMAP